MKKLLLLIFIFAGIFCYAEPLNVKKFNEAIEESRRGGLPVVLVHISRLDLFLQVKKHLLDNPSFMADDGKKFRFFLVDSTITDCISLPPDKLPSPDRVIVFHDDPLHSDGFELAVIKPENYAEKINILIRKRPDEIKYGEYPHGNIEKFYNKVKAGELSYHVYDRDGTHIFHYYLRTYFRGLHIPENIMIDFITELRKKNHPKEFWSKALMLHTQNISSYMARQLTNSWLKIADLLLESGADPNYADEYGLSTAFGLFKQDAGKNLKDYLPFFEKLCKAGLDINRLYPNKMYPEQSWVIMRNNGEYFKKTIPAEGEHPWVLNDKTFQNWDDKLYLIEKFGMDINAGRGHFLLDVIINYNIGYNRLKKSRAELAEELLKRGANPNQRYYCGKTVLHYVGLRLPGKEFKECFFLLLKYKADPNLTYPYKNKYDEIFERNIFDALRYSARSDKEIIEALLNAGIKPEYIDIHGFISDGDEDYALYLLEKGCACYSLHRSDRQKMPRLAEAFSKIPKGKFKERAGSKKYLIDYAGMRPKGDKEEQEILLKSIDILEKYTSYRSSANICFSTYLNKRNLSFYYPGGYDYRINIYSVDESFLRNTIFAQTPEQKINSYIKTALAITDSTLSPLYGEPSVWSKKYTGGRDYELMKLKENAVYQLGVLLKTAAEIYLFYPAEKNAVMEYLVPHTGNYLKSQLDMIPAEDDKKMKEAEIKKIVKKIITAYWRGEVPDDAEYDMNQEIADYWNIFYHRFEQYLQKYAALPEKKIVYQKKQFGFSSNAREFIDFEDVTNYEYNRTHQKPEITSFAEKIEHFKRHFSGSRRAKENFGKILDVMLKLPSAKRLLEVISPDTIFLSGSFHSQAMFVAPNIIGIDAAALDGIEKLEKELHITAALISIMVHEMTHAEQFKTGIKNFTRKNDLENFAYNKLEEIHPLVNQYQAALDLLQIPEYGTAAKDLIAAANYPAAQLQKEFPHDWRKKFVELYWTNARDLPYNDKTKNIVRSWYNSYSHSQFYRRAYGKQDPAIDFDKMIQTFGEMMGINLDPEYFRTTDPKKR